MAKNGKKSRKKLIIFSVIGLLVVALGVVVFLGSRKEPVITVQVEKVQPRTITQVVTATGKIQPEVLVKITPEVSGEIVALPVKEGTEGEEGRPPDEDQARYLRRTARSVCGRTAPGQGESQQVRA